MPESNNKMDDPLEALTENVEKILQRLEEIEQRLEQRLEEIEHRMETRFSLHDSELALLRVSQVGGNRPERVRRVPGGYGLIEPKPDWRRERPGRR